MTDDNLDDVQPEKKKEMSKHMDISKPKDFGGYCLRCDTVWVSLGKCKCKPLLKTGVIDHDSWNAAIDAALYEIDDSELYCAVARLKK